MFDFIYGENNMFPNRRRNVKAFVREERPPPIYGMYVVCNLEIHCGRGISIKWWNFPG